MYLFNKNFSFLIVRLARGADYMTVLKMFYLIFSIFHKILYYKTDQTFCQRNFIKLFFHKYF